MIINLLFVLTGAPLIIGVPNEIQEDVRKRRADHRVWVRVIQADDPVIDAHAESEESICPSHFNEIVRVDFYVLKDVSLFRLDPVPFEIAERSLGVVKERPESFEFTKPRIAADLVEALGTCQRPVIRGENPKSDLAKETPEHVKLLGRQDYPEIGLSACQNAPYDLVIIDSNGDRPVVVAGENDVIVLLVTIRDRALILAGLPHIGRRQVAFLRLNLQDDPPHPDRRLVENVSFHFFAEVTLADIANLAGRYQVIVAQRLRNYVLFR